MNYIKRLIGLPGETIAIHRGKLYVLPPGSGIDYNDWIRGADQRRVAAYQLWHRQYMHVDDPARSHEVRPGTVRDHSQPAGDDAGDAPNRVQQRSPGDRTSRKRASPRWAGPKKTAWSEQGTDFQIDECGRRQSGWLHYRHLFRTSATATLHGPEAARRSSPTSWATTPTRPNIAMVRPDRTGSAISCSNATSQVD